MKTPVRVVINIFLILAGVFLVLLNWPYVISEIIQPVSLVIWLLLRTFVLSIDQHYYWWGLILLAVILLFRFFPRSKVVEEAVEETTPNETLRSIEHWRSMYVSDGNSRYHDQFLQREFIHLLVTMYAGQMRVAPVFQLHENLREGTIPLPDDIHAFLFPEEKLLEKRTIWTVLRSFRNLPARMRRSTKTQQTREHDRIIEEILTFFESSLEMDYDERQTFPHEN